MSTLTSVELNYLVFRYLNESGFIHAAFAFGNEAGINKSSIDGTVVPVGALIRLVQKGMQYLEMEANLSNCDVDLDEDFSFLQPLDLLTKDVHELEKIVSERRKKLQKDRNKGSGKEREGGRGLLKGKERRERAKGCEKDREQAENRKELEQKYGNETGPQPMDISTVITSQTCEIPRSEVVVLEGHTSEVCACAWSPTGTLLASGSGDSTARIWKIAQGRCKSTLPNDPLNVLVLKHASAKTNEKTNDVTTLDWNGEGTLLATGSFDGQARIWTSNGELRNTLSKHKGPIFSLKWNKKGDYLLTGSCDQTAIVWDVKGLKCKQQFEFHSGWTLDVDWRNNVSFATSSSDTKIHVCKIGESFPIKTFVGHKGEVNCVKWDPTRSLLASCSDDSTAKIWSMKHDKYLHDFREHSKEIYTIRWSPTGPGTNNPNRSLVLASASFDSTVKLWDVELGKLIYSLNGHRDRVYSLAFSPNGEYLASGSPDKSMLIWSLREGKIVKTYSGDGGVFEVCWNKEGDKIAACFANHTVCVMDFRK